MHPYASRFAALRLTVVLLVLGMASEGQTVTVLATQPWTDTGVFLNQGDVVGIVASGTINYWSGVGGCSIPWPGYPGCIVSPAGIPWPGPCSGSAVAPGLACVSLIGMIGTGAPFEVGIGSAVTAQTSGELMLGVNDGNGAFGDNTGSWVASLSVGQGQLQITTTSLPGGQVGEVYNSAPAAATGGRPFPPTSFSDPYVWSATGLPPGLNVSYFTGELYGAPSVDGSFTTTLVVKDFNGATASKSFPVSIAPSSMKPRFPSAVKQMLADLGTGFSWQSGFWKQLLDACKQATAGEPPGDPLAANCNTQSVLYLLSDVAAYGLNGLASFDPVDPNYTVIAQPVPLTIVVTPSEPTWTAPQLATYTAFVKTVTTTNNLIALQQATMTSINRAEGAFEAGNTYWEQQQVSAISRYTQLMVFHLQLLLTEEAQFNATLGIAGNGFPLATITPDQATQFSIGIATNGLPIDVQQALTSLGIPSLAVGADVIAFTAKAWSSFNPAVISGVTSHAFDATGVPAEQLIAALITQFSTLTGKVSRGTQEFELNASFALGANSNGVHPGAEDVSFSVGSNAFTIPAGKFKRSSKGIYQFEGRVNGTNLEGAISPTATGYQFQIEGGSALPGLSSPTTLAVWIGDDGGTVLVK
jgi:hypothetical protein